MAQLDYILEVYNTDTDEWDFVKDFATYSMGLKFMHRKGRENPSVLYRLRNQKAEQIAS